MQYSQQKEQNLSHSHYFKPTPPERCQKNSFEVKQPLSRSSQFIIGSQAKLSNSAHTSTGSQNKGNHKRISHTLLPPPPTPGVDDFEMPNHRGNPRRISRGLPPLPPTPGADDFEVTKHSGDPRRISCVLPPPPPTSGQDDFEPTIHTGSTRRANNEQWKPRAEDRVNRATAGTTNQPHKWSTVKQDDLPEELETEDWDIFPVGATPRMQRNTYISSQKGHIPTNLTSMASLTSVDPLVMQGKERKGGFCSKGNSAVIIDDDSSASGRAQR